jgi:DNA-binding NarL/FixJ family response regulator
MAVGARGFVNKQASVGLESLSNRELEVLSLIGRGQGSSEIAARRLLVGVRIARGRPNTRAHAVR